MNSLWRLILSVTHFRIFFWTISSGSHVIGLNEKAQIVMFKKKHKTFRVPRQTNFNWLFSNFQT